MQLCGALLPGKKHWLTAGAIRVIHRADIHDAPTAQNRPIHDAWVAWAPMPCGLTVSPALCDVPDMHTDI